MNDQKQTNTQEMLGSLQRMSYHLKNISTCCTIIAAYVVVKCAWWFWLTFEAVASLPIE